MAKAKPILRPATEAAFVYGLEGTRVVLADHLPSVGMDELTLTFSNGHKLRCMRGKSNPGSPAANTLLIDLYVPVLTIGEASDADNHIPNA